MNTNCENVCRICLSVMNESTLNIFDHNLRSFLVRFERLIGHAVIPGSYLPTEICVRCVHQIKQVVSVVDTWSQTQYDLNAHQLSCTIQENEQEMINNDATLVGPSQNQLRNPSASYVQNWVPPNMVMPNNTSNPPTTTSTITKKHDYKETFLFDSDPKQTAFLFGNDKDTHLNQHSDEKKARKFQNPNRMENSAIRNNENFLKSIHKSRNPCFLSIQDLETTCIICRGKFSHSTIRSSHESHHEEYYISCKNCKKGFETVQELRNHVSCFENLDT